MPSCCHLPRESQPPQSTVSLHMLRCLFPGLAWCSQGFPKGVLQSLSFLHRYPSSVGRVQPLPVHTPPPTTREGRGKQLSRAHCSAPPLPRGVFTNFIGGKTSKRSISPQAFLPAPETYPLLFTRENVINNYYRALSNTIHFYLNLF